LKLYLHGGEDIIIENVISNSV